MDAKLSALLRHGFEAYLARCDRGGLDPLIEILPYEFDSTAMFRWSMLGGEMVADELREMTNILNGWHGSLQRWQAWNQVTEALEFEAAWYLRKEIVETDIYRAISHSSPTVPGCDVAL